MKERRTELVQMEPIAKPGKVRLLVRWWHGQPINRWSVRSIIIGMPRAEQIVKTGRLDK